ncbi:MAG TPA: RHS repeat-associated core domain-containing protein, partial [Pyrinomonadaceae bacterium]|nr:RHS repeat-associated core domain-containing protein [Pyrinomonadaceae bacterium]
MNDDGVYQAGGVGTWGDVFTYDERSNLTSRTDARGVKTVYNFNDPLNRLQSVSWDTNGFGDSNNPILPAATVSYAYRTKDSPTHLRDITQFSSVTTAGISTETYGYDAEERVNFKSLAVNGRPPMETNYAYDALDRIQDVTYPRRELGVVGSPRKVVHYDYDVASRLTSLTVDGAVHASNIVYNAASQTSSLSVGAAGANQIIESYNYEQQTGLLASQTVARFSSPANLLLNLAYDYAGPNGKRTGQLTKILNNLNHDKDRSYSYDALGRLVQAKGGPASAPRWTQTYTYDIFGNRTSVSASGYSARSNTPDPQSAIGNRQLAMADRGSSPTVREGAVATAATSPGTEGTAPAAPELGAVATASSANPTVTLPTLSPKPIAEGEQVSRPATNSHHASRSPQPNSVTPQGPPVFSDDPLVAGVTIKAVHITELRAAVNQARARASLAAANWAESVTAGVSIKAAHIVELRARLDEARIALGLSAASYTDPSLVVGTTPVKAAHIQELRQRVTETLTTNFAIPLDGHANLSYDTSSNRITTTGFAYDAAGNQVRALAPGGLVSQRFQYDAANRLVNVKTNDQNPAIIATYTYGSSNERLILEEGGVRTYYACDGSAEYTESGSSTTPQWTKTYIYLGARLLSTLTPNGPGHSVQYHHPDRLGTRLVTNAQDTNFFEQQTLPFGTALNESLAPGATAGQTNRRFTSYDRSVNTGLDYAINRHYDAQQGRFTQVDPIGMSASSMTNPQSLNMYGYVGNDPVNRTDPTGLFWGKVFGFFKKLIKVVMVALAVALIVVAIINIGNPLVSAAMLWGALALAGLLFGAALGPTWLKRAISVAGAVAAIHIRRPGPIWNFSNPGNGRSGRMDGGLSGIGAITMFLQDLPKPQPKPGPEGSSAGKRLS